MVDIPSIGYNPNFMNGWGTSGFLGSNSGVNSGIVAGDQVLNAPLPTLGSSGGLGGFGNSSGFGWNVPTAQLALSGIGTLGSLWGAFQAANLAKKQFNFTKDVTNTNLNNQIKSYNTALEDRSRSRAVVEGQSAADAQAYVDRNRLSRG